MTLINRADPEPAVGTRWEPVDWRDDPNLPILRFFRAPDGWLLEAEKATVRATAWENIPAELFPMDEVIT